MFEKQEAFALRWHISDGNHGIKIIIICQWYKVLIRKLIYEYKIVDICHLSERWLATERLR